MTRALLICAFLVAGAVAGAGAAEDIMSRFTPHEFRAASGRCKQTPLKYRLLAPANIEAGKKYPVILFLHGSGERGTDNRAQLKFLPTLLSDPEMRKKYPCFLIAPQCPPDRRWGSIDWKGGKTTYDANLGDELQAAFDALKEVMASQPIDADRVYLTGLSMGGYGSWELATRHPEVFAAVAPICGGGDKTDVKPLAGLPLWAWHGDADPAVNVERSREMIAAIKVAGGKPKYTELPGVGHNSWDAAYTRPDGVVPWIFTQVRKTEKK